MNHTNIVRKNLIYGMDYRPLINGHVLYKIRESWVVYVPTTEEFFHILTKKDSEGEDCFVIYNERAETYMIRPYQDQVKVSNLVKDYQGVDEEDYSFYEFDSAINMLNKYIYEVV